MRVAAIPAVLTLLGVAASGCATVNGSMSGVATPALAASAVDVERDMHPEEPIAPGIGELANPAATLGVLREPASGGESWQFLIAPYLWAVNLDGDIAAGGTTVPVDVGFGDILDDFNGGGSLFFEASRGQWAFMLDGTYISLESSETVSPGVEVDMDTTVGLLQVDGAYRLAPDSVWELTAGVRLVDVDNDISVSGSPPASGGLTSTQAVFGARGRWEFGERWNLRVRGDVGLGSGDSSWQLLGLAGYELGKHWGLHFGYRAMELDVKDGAVELDALIHGLMFGAAFAW